MANRVDPGQMPHFAAINLVLTLNTVDSRYLEFQGTLKNFEVSVPRHIRFAKLRKKIIRTTTFNKYICNWTLEVRDIL